MPWTTGDVDEHKAGLTDVQKRQWVATANQVRSECLDEGGTESSCDARAIRIANGVVNNEKQDMETKLIDYLRVSTVDYEIRREQYDGKQHMVLPIVMMVEGVHSGSAGPILHLAEELGAVPGAWNGMPVVIQHPEDEDGNMISANLTSQVDNIIGRVHNVYMEEDRLKGEVWIDEQRLIAHSPHTLRYIEEHHPIDVSVGVFNDEEEIEGDWNGEHYRAIARNHRPDHLALLPDGAGACSWEDGCGIRLNQEKGGKMANNKDDPKKVKVTATLNEASEPDFDCMRDLKGSGVRVSPIIANETGLRAIVMNVQRKLDMMDTDSRMHFLQEAYDDYFIYEVRNRDGSSAFYKREYNVDDDSEEVEFSTEYTEVRKKVEYVNVNIKRTKFSSNKKVNTMAKNKNERTPCKEKIDSLIANEATKWTEDDRETLEGFEEDVLDKLIPEVKEEKPKVNTEKNDPPEKEKKEDPVTFKKLMESLPEDEKEAYQYGTRLYAERKERMVKDILDNTEDVWTEDELKSMKMETLSKVHNSLKIETDYSLSGGKPPEIETNEEKLLPTGVKEETETK